MNKSLEVRIAYGPSCGWEAALVVVNGYGAVQRPVSGLANPAVYQQYLLVYLLSLVTGHGQTSSHGGESSGCDHARNGYHGDLRRCAQ